MTKKDYQRIALAMRNVLKNPFYYGSGWIVVLEELTKVLAEDNPRFNKKKFVAACYGEK